jgi:hypothetical protein
MQLTGLWRGIFCMLEWQWIGRPGFLLFPTVLVFYYPHQPKGDGLDVWFTKTCTNIKTFERDGMVDIPDLKSVGPCARVGSTPTARTTLNIDF